MIPTVAEMIAVSNITGCVSLGSNTLQVSLNDQGLPIESSSAYAQINSTRTTDQIGRFVPNIGTPPMLLTASRTPVQPGTFEINVLPWIT